MADGKARNSDMRNVSARRMSERPSARNVRKSRISTSGRRADGRDVLQVWDERGVDVTPKPMMAPLKPTVGAPPAKGAAGPYGTEQGGTGTSTPNSEMDSTLERMSSAGFSRSSFSLTSDESASTPDESRSEVGAQEPEDDTEAEAAQARPRVQVAHAGALAAAAATEEELERPVKLTLVETDTFTLMNLPARCVAADAAEAAEVSRVNERYMGLLRAKRATDNYVDASVQTLNMLLKNKEVHDVSASALAAGSQVTAWDIADALAGGAALTPEAEAAAKAAAAAAALEALNIESRKVSTSRAPAPPPAAGGSSAPTPVNPRRGSTMASFFGTQKSGVSDPGPSITAAAAPAPAAPPPQREGDGVEEGGERLTDLATVEGLHAALVVMERAVAQNIYHPKLLMYRSFVQGGGSSSPGGGPASPPPQAQAVVPPVPAAGPARGAAPAAAPAMHLLWQFSCEHTAGKNVSCMAWNSAKKDLLAVGYGEYEFSNQQPGLLAFWSLKSPEYPMRLYHTACGVTTLAFSKQHPNLLAVGMYDGTVAIYDVRQALDRPVLESTHTSGKHSDPVWKLRWVERASDASETIVSVSSDGRVTQWFIKKGLEFADLMKLKRVSGKGHNLPEAFISRRSSGMCFDFSQRDATIYVAGTEDGNIHRCSVSYSEQYLDNYFGHTGPVYQIAWSPFKHSHFLSCSADWTVRLWKEEQEQALMVFESGKTSVADICWSRTNSTVFGAVTTDGRVEIWNIAQSTLRPVLCHVLPDTKLACILFAEASPVVVAGGSNGAVAVFRLAGVEKSEVDPELERLLLERSLDSNLVASAKEEHHTAEHHE